MNLALARLAITMTAASFAAVAGGIQGLDADGPAQEFASKLMLFGQFAGDWKCDVALMLPDRTKVAGTCEWHFGWTLEGRAIQDVWIAHYDTGKTGAPTGGYGTTIRWYDPKSGDWQVIWISARDNVTHRFLARKSGDEIVMSAQDNPEHPSRWIFSEVTPQSFRWRSENSLDGGKTWIVGQEMTARRVASTQREPESDRRAIEQMEHDWLKGEHDHAVLERVLADDFVHPVSAGIFLTKSQHIAWAVKHPRPAGHVARFDRLDVRLYGDTAIASGIVNEADASGAARRRTVFTDIFVYRSGKWQAVSAEETPALN